MNAILLEKATSLRDGRQSAEGFEACGGGAGRPTLSG